MNLLKTKERINDLSPLGMSVLILRFKVSGKIFQT
jgi:hypothetical protein